MTVIGNKISVNLESTLPPPHFYIGGHRLPHLKKLLPGPDIIPEEIEFYIESDRPVSLKRQITYSIRENIFFLTCQIKVFPGEVQKGTIVCGSIVGKKRTNCQENGCRVIFTL